MCLAGLAKLSYKIRVDKFSFFFAFYGLILGLAVTELLSGFARLIQARALKHLGLQTALLALLVFVVICATWIEAWDTLKAISLDFDGLWSPILLATFLYLAAALVFPRENKELTHLNEYYTERKKFIVGSLLIAEFLVDYTYRHVFIEAYSHEPAMFWLWFLPYNALIKGNYLGLFFVRDRRANIMFLLVLLVLFLALHSDHGAIQRAIIQRFGW